MALQPPGCSCFGNLKQCPGDKNLVSKPDVNQEPNLHRQETELVKGLSSSQAARRFC